MKYLIIIAMFIGLTGCASSPGYGWRAHESADWIQRRQDSQALFNSNMIQQDRNFQMQRESWRRADRAMWSRMDSQLGN